MKLDPHSYLDRLGLPLLLLLTGLLYLPALGGGFVGWDDALILNNPHLRSLAWDNLRSILFPAAGELASYQPLRTLAHALVYAVAGAAPRGYLALNLALFLLNILLLHRLARRLLERHGAAGVRPAPVALLAAGLFALHPVQVEAVAWLQGGKLTLMGAFFLGSVLGWLEYRRQGGRRWYCLSLGLYLAALGSQPGAVALPLLLAGYELLARRGAGPPLRRILPLLAFFLPALALGLYLVLGTTVSHPQLDPGGLLAALLDLPRLWLEYLGRLLLPLGLCARYARALPAAPPYLTGSMAAVSLALIAWAAWRCAGRSVVAGLGLAWFAAGLLPTSGLIPTSTLMADRYLYLPGMGFALLLALLISHLPGKLPSAARSLPWLGLLLLAGWWGSLTVARQQDWRDALTLWSRVVRVEPGLALGHFNLAEALAARGERAAAIGHYRRALELEPGDGDACGNLAVLLRQEGREREAMELLQRALRLQPDRAEHWINLGIGLADAGRDREALTAFARAIGRGGRAEWLGYYNRGKLRLRRGEREAALADFARAVERGAEWITTAGWLDLGRSLEAAGLAPQAVELLRTGCDRPAFDNACWRMLGNLELLAGDPAAAARSLETAVERGDDGFESLALLGYARHGLGEPARAVAAYRLALERGGAGQPGLLNNLGLALQDQGDPAAAERSYREALELDPGYLPAWLNLALLQRSRAEFPQARRSLEQARKLSAGQPGRQAVTARVDSLLATLPAALAGKGR